MHCHVITVHLYKTAYAGPSNVENVSSSSPPTQCHPKQNTSETSIAYTSACAPNIIAPTYTGMSLQRF